MTSVSICYVGLGSNLDHPQQQINTALTELHHLPQVEYIQSSSLYLSRPMGSADQPDYVNAVARLGARCSPRELLDALLDLEVQHGRQRDPTGARNQPRTLDMDLLLFGNQQLNQPGLVVPHPGLHQRDFVFLPLLELEPELIVPGRGRLADICDRQNSFGANRLQQPNQT